MTPLAIEQRCHAGRRQGKDLRSDGHYRHDCGSEFWRRIKARATNLPQDALDTRMSLRARSSLTSRCIVQLAIPPLLLHSSFCWICATHTTATNGRVARKSEKLLSLHPILQYNPYGSATLA